MAAAKPALTPWGLSPADLLLIPKLRRVGIVVPYRMLAACRKTGLPVALGASILVQESGGGHNLWGHDPTIFAGGYDAKHHVGYGPTVTKKAYQQYLLERGPEGKGGMQGVGPCQLTYWSFQDEADKAGGCWDQLPNMKVGFGHLAANVRRSGLAAGVAAYNGSGPAAKRYASEVLTRARVFSETLGTPWPPK